MTRASTSKQTTLETEGPTFRWSRGKDFPCKLFNFFKLFLILISEGKQHQLILLKYTRAQKQPKVDRLLVFGSGKRILQFYNIK